MICSASGKIIIQNREYTEGLKHDLHILGECALTGDWAGAAILLWLSWKIGTSKFEPPHEVKTSKPWGFFQAAAFQWVNPKAWIMAISFAGQQPDQEPFWYPPLVISLVILAAGMLSSHGWVLFGVGIQRFLSTPLRFRIFSLVMAGLLVLTVIGLLLADLSVH